MHPKQVNKIKNTFIIDIVYSMVLIIVIIQLYNNHLIIKKTAQENGLITINLMDTSEEVSLLNLRLGILQDSYYRLEANLSDIVKDETPEVAEILALTEYKVKPLNQPNGTYQLFELTSYCSCPICCGKKIDHPAYGTTRSGTKVEEGRTIAVDTNVIPMGSKVYIEGYGIFTAEDTGSAIKGNIIDIYISDHDRASIFGRQCDIKVWILD